MVTNVPRLSLNMSTQPVETSEASVFRAKVRLNLSNENRVVAIVVGRGVPDFDPVFDGVAVLVDVEVGARDWGRDAALVEEAAKKRTPTMQNLKSENI